MASRETYLLDQLKTLLSKVVLNTVQTYFELKIVNVESTLYLFLHNRVHELFHYFVPQIPCCNTQNPCALATKRRTLTKEQFSLLYKNDPTIQPIHEKKEKGRIVQHCICPFSPNNATNVTDLDITLINCLIKTCRRTPAGNPNCLKDIIEVRNCLSHIGDDSSVKDQDVYDWWIKLESAAVNMAGTIGVAYQKGVERRISEIRTSQSQLKDVIDALNKRDDDLEVKIVNALQNNVVRVGTGKCNVVWKFTNPGNWVVDKMKVKLDLLKRIGDFIIEFVYQGSLVIHTVADINILSDERRFKDSIEEFLFLFVQLLVIQEPKAAGLDVALSIWLPQLDAAKQGEELRETSTDQLSSAQCPVPKSSIDDIKPSLLKTYNVTERGNKVNVSGCDLLPNGDFVIADGRVQYVKYYDNQGVLKKQINTESCEPFDVCFIDNNTIAVSIAWPSTNHDHILFVSTTENKVTKKVQVGPLFNRLYFDNVLVVANDGLPISNVLIIDKNGDIKNEFKTNNSGRKKITNTKSGRISVSKKMIYYTKRREDAVVCCDESGIIKWRYKGLSVKEPWGVVVNDQGFVFVSNNKSDSVVVISPDGQTSRVILGPEQGLDEPIALSINHKDRKLMVCNSEDGKVFLYQL